MISLTNDLQSEITIFLTKVEKGEITIKSPQRKKKLLESQTKYKKNKETLKEYQELEKENLDEEEKKTVKEQINTLNKEKDLLFQQIREQILEDERIKQNVIVEIRPGTGGTEANLFARDLYTMYAKLADKQKWKLELIETKVDYEGNFTFVSFLLKGEEVYNWLKNESGVHRVQRVPKTESKGRVHTSTATVAILPEPSDIVLNIKPQELKIEAFAAGGPGGQHVNKTESAIRITHIPTGITAISQESRDQRTNREKAYLVVKSRILAKKKEEERTKQETLRSSMIGSGERFEKIRTYNWMQNRVTDHRLNLTWNKLDMIINGDCQELCEELMNYELKKILIKQEID